MAVLSETGCFSPQHFGRAKTDAARRSPSRSRCYWRKALLIALVLLAATAVCHSQADGVTEDEIKAAFLYNFVKFVEWPPEVFPDPSGPVRICVFGNSPLKPDLQQIVAGKKIETRPLEVYRVGLFQIRTCQVVFVGRAENDRLPQVLEAARGSGTLTVGDIPGFLEQGGMINFVFDQSRVRFEVNLKAAREARLKLSSKLLNLAKSVEK